MSRGALLLSLIALLWVRPPACAEEEDPLERLKGQIETLEQEVQLLRRQVAWFELLQRGRRRRSATRVHAIPLDGGPQGAESESAHLRGIRLAEKATKDDVRLYVARILAAASHRQICSPTDREVELLRRVGSQGVEILIEPLLYVPFLNCSSGYLIDALVTLAQDEHKQLILDCMTLTHKAEELVLVVLAKGWTDDAAPILLSALAQRSPDLPGHWVEAAAQVAAPEHYDDLKLQIAIGYDPLWVWKAIRDLPGMEPLDELVESAWRNTTRKRGSWGWRGLTIVAAHYGHLDALEVLVEGSNEQGDQGWGAFQKLTGFGVGRRERDREKDAKKWFATHKDRLVYDRARMRYSIGE